MTDDAPLDDDRLVRARLDKLEALREAGTDPYPVRFERTHSAAAIAEAHPDLEPGAETGERVTVAGRLVGFRDIGKLAFGVLNDWSGTIQLFVQRNVLGEEFDAFADLDLGDWVGATGEVITTRRGELSVRVESFELLAKGLRPLPEKWHGLKDVETRYRRRYVDLIVNEEARRIARARSAVVASLRRSLDDRGFLEVETPTLHGRPGGALARPFETHHNALGVDMYLRIALELHLKRLVVGGIERVYEIGRVFRNEGVSPRHNPEFTMLELYQAFADYGDMMDLTEALVVEAAERVAGTTDLEYGDRPLSLAAPWRRIDYVESVSEATGVDWRLDMPLDEARSRAGEHGIEADPAWGVGKIVAEVWEATVEPELWEPTIVVDYPAEISPLARMHRSKPGVTERFEVIVAGRELANAFSELNDPVDQRRRFEAQAEARAGGDDEAHPVDEDYLRALEYGLPPTGGMGLGVDRLVMLLTGQETIREVVLVPHLRPE
ncbi:MAG: lysine--tRNA ligase [Acidimicrobiia bacterium]|nr:lysine--tRNA ligase [Acidimicrobiia bacterium]